MEAPIAQTQREWIYFPAAWAKAGLSERRELCSMFHPDGLVWSHSMGFLNSQNTSIMQDLSDSLNDADDFVKFGVPDDDPFEHLLATIAAATPLYEICARVLG